MGTFGTVLIDGLSVGAIYALIAVGFTMVYGVLRLLNFAHSEVFSAGAFAGLLVFNSSGSYIGFLPEEYQFLAVLLITLLFGALASAIMAVFIERVAYFPLRGKPAIQTLVTTIAVSIFLQQVGIHFVAGSKSVSYPMLQNIDPTTFTLVTLVIVSGGLYWFVFHRPYGVRIRAVAEDSILAQLSGINYNRTVILTFAIGGLIAGIGGVVYGFRAGRIHPEMGFDLAIKAFMMAVVGTIGDIRGAVIGGLILGIVEVLAQTFLPPGFTSLRDGVAFSFIILFLAISPTGIAQTVQKIRQFLRVQRILRNAAADKPSFNGEGS